jgi:hypothetical protein
LNRGCRCKRTNVGSHAPNTPPSTTCGSIPRHDIAPSLLTAQLIVSRWAELRSLLDLYAAALRRCVHFEHNDDEGLF